MGTGLFVLDAAGHPKPEPDVLVWAEWFGSVDRQVAVDEIGDVRVSTVFLGVDHQFNLGGPPLLYETMVFGGTLDEEMRRYPTRAAALKGHARMVKRVRQSIGNGE